MTAKGLAEPDASVWHMSWGDWGIVLSLAVLVWMLVVCVILSSSTAEETLPPKSDKPDAPRAVSKHAPDSHRQAA